MNVHRTQTLEELDPKVAPDVEPSDDGPVCQRRVHHHRHQELPDRCLLNELAEKQPLLSEQTGIGHRRVDPENEGRFRFSKQSVGTQCLCSRPEGFRLTFRPETVVGPFVGLCVTGESDNLPP